MKQITQDVQSLMPTKKPTRDDIAFFAGFYEGEGSCSRLKKNPGPIIVIAQKDPEMLYRMRELWGGSVRLRKNCNKPSRQLEGHDSWMNPYFKLSLSGDRARLFIKDVYPYLSARRKEQVDRTNWRELTGVAVRTHGGMSPERAALRVGMTWKQKRAEEMRHYRGKIRASRRDVRAVEENFLAKESIQ